jgi:hypothetical protein
VQTAYSASGKSSGILASVVGVTTLLITASGLSGEMQSALNAIWKAQPQGTTVSMGAVNRSSTSSSRSPANRSCCRTPSTSIRLS